MKCFLCGIITTLEVLHCGIITTLEVLHCGIITTLEVLHCGIITIRNRVTFSCLCFLSMFTEGTVIVLKF